MRRRKTIALVALVIAAAFGTWHVVGGGHGPAAPVIRISKGPDVGSRRLARTFEITVVDRDTGSPVVEAAVMWCRSWGPGELTGTETARRERALSQGLEAACREFGERSTTDGSGRVSFPRVGEEIGVFVRVGDRFGQIHFGDYAIETDLRIEIGVDRRLPIFVVDHAGQPAEGVTVRAWAFASDGSGRELELEPTDASGAARLALEPSERGAISRVEYRCVIAGYASPKIGRTVRELESARDVIKLPPTERLRVRVLAGSEILPGRYELSVRGLGTDGSKPRGLTVGLQRRPAGVHRIGHARLGLRYSVSVAGDGFDFECEIPGPAKKGDADVREVSVPAHMCLVRGRALDASGAVLGSTEILSQGDGSPTTTDENGCFLIPYDGRENVPSRVQCRVSGIARGPALGGTAVPRLIPGSGVHEFGDVVFHPLPLFLTGTLLIDGQPPRGFGFGWPLIERRPENQPDAPWSADHPWEINWISPGRFQVLRGIDESGAGVRHEPGQRLRFRVAGVGLLPAAPVEVPVRTAHVGLDVRRGAEVGARLRFGAKLAGHSVRAELRASGVAKSPPGAPEDVRHHGHRVDGNGGDTWFAWYAMPPGEYDLHVYAAGRRLPLLIVESIEVPVNAERCDDTRLADIDLRSAVRVFRVRVQNADGKPIDGASVFVSHGDAGGPLECVSSRSSGVSIVTAQRSVDLWVVEPGFQDARVEGVSSDTSIELQPVNTVSVPVRGAPSFLLDLPANTAWSVSFKIASNAETTYTGFGVDGPYSGTLASLRSAAVQVGSGRRAMWANLQPNMAYRVTLAIHTAERRVEVQGWERTYTAEGRMLEELRSTRAPVLIDPPKKAVDSALGR